MASTLCYDLIDAMTEIPFAGNPTPVFLLGKNQPWLSDSKMQLLAREMFHSESVFVRQPGNGVGHFDIVFFTPFAEESFCSHGIMGATYVLSGVPPANQDGYSFRLRNGIVAQTCVSSQTSSKRSLLGEIREIIMVIPSAPPSISHASVTSEKTQIERFAQALKIDIDQVLHIGLNSLDDWVIELDPSLDISSMNMYIDPCTLLEASPKGTGSQIITTRSRTPGVDFYKRVFAYGSEGMKIKRRYFLAWILTFSQIKVQDLPTRLWALTGPRN